MTIADELQATIEQMVQPGKGLLTTDESQPTIAKRFAAIDVESTEENRRAYRALQQPVLQAWQDKAENIATAQRLAEVSQGEWCCTEGCIPLADGVGRVRQRKK
ncbi:MAG: class I fructose-bisphosphate aldolase [Nitrosomonas sp.]